MGWKGKPSTKNMHEIVELLQPQKHCYLNIYMTSSYDTPQAKSFFVVIDYTQICV